MKSHAQGEAGYVQSIQSIVQVTESIGSFFVSSVRTETRKKRKHCVETDKTVNK